MRARPPPSPKNPKQNLRPPPARQLPARRPTLTRALPPSPRSPLPPGERINGDCPHHYNCYAPCAEADYGTWVEVDGSPYGGQAYCERFPRPAREPAGFSGAYTYLAMARRLSHMLRPPVPLRRRARALPQSLVCPAPRPPTLPPPYSETEHNSNTHTQAHNLKTSKPAGKQQAQAGKADVPIANFDNIFSAMITIFQLLTTENWNALLFDGMRFISTISCLFFVGAREGWWWGGGRRRRRWLGGGGGGGELLHLCMWF